MEKARSASAVGGVDVGALGKKPFEVTLAPGFQVSLGEYGDGRRQFLKGAGRKRTRDHDFFQGRWAGLKTKGAQTEQQRACAK